MDSRLPAGWYADPWVPGQQRYWTGERWAADVFMADLTQAAVVDERVTAAHGPPPTEPAETAPPAPTWQVPPTEPKAVVVGPAPAVVAPAADHRNWLIGVAVALAVVLTLVGLVWRLQGQSDQRAAPAPLPASPTPAVPTPSPSPSGPASPTPSPDASQGTIEQVLARLVVRQQDVPKRFTVDPIPGGTSVAGGPTLDLCNGSYPSERQRVGRLQVEALDRSGGRTLSTEAVQYRDAAGTAQAFDEVRAVVSACQPEFTIDFSTGEAIERTVSPASEESWGSTPGVDRLSYVVTETSVNGLQPGTSPRQSLVVYLKRGPLFLGLYFPDGTGKQMPVEGRDQVPQIVKLFEERLLETPPGVGGGSPDPGQDFGQDSGPTGPGA